MITLDRLFILLFLGLAAALIWWLEGIVQTSQDEILKKEHNRPDFYMQNFTLRNYNKQGELRYRLNGRSMVQYPKDNSLEIKKMDMLSHKRDAAPVSVTSDTAVINEQGNQALLTGDVVIHRDKTAEEDMLEIKTPKLFLDTEREYAETDQPITIVNSKHTMNAIGMEAWLAHDKVRLLSKVRGTHEP